MLRSALHVLLGTLVCALVFPWLNQRQRGPLVSWWARGFVAALGLRLRVLGHWPAQPGRYLLASNHISWLDIFVIHAVKPVRFVSKSEVRSWPLAGWLASGAGTLFVDRTRKRDTLDIGQQMHDALAAGDAIGIFPEGTTSDGTVVLPFFSSLLQPAVRSEATLVPAGVCYRRAEGGANTEFAYIGEQTFMESVRATLCQPPTEVEVRFGEPFPAGQAHRRELTRKLEHAVAVLLELPVDRHWRPPGDSGDAHPARPDFRSVPPPP
jgi:1-acyl-sn-glycerol-3-phosphate acyltransferase